LFARAIGPFRWIALSNDADDIRKIDDLLLARFSHNHIVTNWIRLARAHVPFQGLPSRIAWLGHGDAPSSASKSTAWCVTGRCPPRSPSPATISTPVP